MNRHLILGTDWWTDCDDVAALRIACRMAKNGVWNFDGVILNACMEYSASSLDSFIRAEGLNVPIGIDLAAIDFGGTPAYQQRLAEIGRSGLSNKGAEKGVSLYRRLLAAIPDGEAEICEIGFLQVLAGLLHSQPDEFSPLNGIELVRRKVRMLWIMGGDWQSESYGSEHNFNRNDRARIGAHTVVAEYPGEICFLGFEVGSTVITHPNGIASDLLNIAFTAHGSAKGRSSWDPMLLLMAAQCPSGSAAELAAAGYEAIRGTAAVDPATGANSFTQNENGLHRYVRKRKPDQWYSDRMTKLVE